MQLKNTEEPCDGTAPKTFLRGTRVNVTPYRHRSPPQDTVYNALEEDIQDSEHTVVSFLLKASTKVAALAQNRSTIATVAIVPSRDALVLRVQP